MNLSVYAPYFAHNMWQIKWEHAERIGGTQDVEPHKKPTTITTTATHSAINIFRCSSKAFRFICMRETIVVSWEKKRKRKSRRYILGGTFPPKLFRELVVIMHSNACDDEDETHSYCRSQYFVVTGHRPNKLKPILFHTKRCGKLGKKALVVRVCTILFVTYRITNASTRFYCAAQWNAVVTIFINKRYVTHTHSHTQSDIYDFRIAIRSCIVCVFSILNNFQTMAYINSWSLCRWKISKPNY